MAKSQPTKMNGPTREEWVKYFRLTKSQTATVDAFGNPITSQSAEQLADEAIKRFNAQGLSTAEKTAMRAETMRVRRTIKNYPFEVPPTRVEQDNMLRSQQARAEVDAAQQKVGRQLGDDRARAKAQKQYIGQEATKDFPDERLRAKPGRPSVALSKGKASLGIFEKLRGTKYSTIDDVLRSFGDEGGTADEIARTLQRNALKDGMKSMKGLGEEARKAAEAKLRADVSRITPEKVAAMLENNKFKNVVARRMVKGVERYGAGAIMTENASAMSKMSQAATRYVTGRSIGGVAAQGLKAGALRVGMGVAGRVFLPLWIAAELWDKTIGTAQRDIEESAMDVSRGEGIGQMILAQGRSARAEGAIRGAEGRLAVDALVSGRQQDLAAASPEPENDPDQFLQMLMGGTSAQ